MPRRAGLERLRTRDPGLAAVRRAGRVALVACTGFYTARCGLGNDVAAIYTLFGAIATGGTSSSAGRPADPLPHYAVDAALWLTSLHGTVTAIRRTPDEPRTPVPG
ncbi:hypothetical protein ACWERI_02870 [Streptomyces collinus]